jgi:hypothetical protein
VWAACPGSELELIMGPDDFRATHRYNRSGFRGDDFSIVPGTDIRIVCVGDSYTEGVGAEEDASWPSFLAGELTDIDAEVINLGDSGSGLARYATIVNSVGLFLSPTDMILCINTLDLRHGPQMPKNLNPGQGFENPFRKNRSFWIRPLVAVIPGWIYLIDRIRGRWPVQTGLYWNAYTDEMTEEAVRGVAQLYNLPTEEAVKAVDERINALAAGVLGAARARKFNPTMVQNTLVLPFWTYECRVEDLSLPPETMRERMHIWLQWYGSVCRRQNARPWLLYFPEASLVSQGNWGPLRDQLYANIPNIVGDTSVRDMLNVICTELEIGFIDASAILTAHGSEKLFFRYDPHPTGRAYELVARAAAEEMQPVLRSQK